MLLDDRDNNTVRFIFKNYNSIKYWTEKERHRIQTIDDTRQRLQADATAGCEVGADWAKLSADDTRHYNLFATGEDKKSTVASNRNKSITQSQYGGVSLMTTGIVSNYT